MVARWVVVLACTGCNWALGFKHFDHVDGEVPVDLPPPHVVTGTFMQRYLSNDGAGNPTKHTDPLVAGQGKATLRFIDGTSAPLALSAAGEFTFVGSPGSYMIQIDTGFGHTLYDLDAPDLVLVDRFGGRRDRAPVPQFTSLSVNFTTDPTPPTAKEEIQSTGVWSRWSPDVIGSGYYSLDWTKMPGANGTMGLLDGAKHDGFYYAHYYPGSYTYLDQYVQFTNVTLTGGQLTPFDAMNTTAVSISQCAHVVAATRAEIMRLDAAEPSSQSTSALWSISAAPDGEFAQFVAFPLAYTGYIPGDIDVTASFATPYAGYETDVLVLVTAFHGDGYTSSSYVTQPLACTSQTNVPLGQVALPTHPTIGGTAIANTNMTTAIALDLSKPVPITFDVAGGGSADIYVVRLLDATVPASAMPIEELQVVTTRTAFTIDPAAFTMGHRYQLYIDAVLGYPNATRGDLDMQVHDLATARYASATFQL